jgi:hypothetical protein
VLAAAVPWRWIEHTVAADVRNPEHARQEFGPFESWQEVDALAHELGPFGPLVIFCVGTGVRPEGRSVRLGRRRPRGARVDGAARVREASAEAVSEGGARRRVPLRSKVDDLDAHAAA